METPKVIATLYVSVDTECPKCEKLIDLMEIMEAEDIWPVIEDSRSGWVNIDKEFDCPHCNETLIFDEMVY